MSADEWVNGWIKGFIEAQGSFAMNIGLGESKKAKWVVFKPYISISNVDEKQVEFIKDYFNFKSGISAKKIKKTYENQVFSLNIQRIDDIDILLEKFKNHKFKSDVKQQAYDNFLMCYEQAKIIGFTHRKNSEEITYLLDLKLKINRKRGNIDKNRIARAEWLRRIETHFIM